MKKSITNEVRNKKVIEISNSSEITQNDVMGNKFEKLVIVNCYYETSDKLLIIIIIIIIIILIIVMVIIIISL